MSWELSKRGTSSPLPLPGCAPAARVPPRRYPPLTVLPLTGELLLRNESMDTMWRTSEDTSRLAGGVVVTLFSHRGTLALSPSQRLRKRLEIVTQSPSFSLHPVVGCG